jgi:hypothetical protein
MRERRDSLDDLASFQTFTSGIAGRCEEPLAPASAAGRLVGSYPSPAFPGHKTAPSIALIVLIYRSILQRVPVVIG